MSKRVRGIVICSIAVTLTLGAARLASGGDLSQARLETPASMHDINRVGKSDRGITTRRIQASQTIGINLVNQSILLRIPTAQAARRAPDPQKSSLRRRAMVACEPVVSVLTDVARLLQPGRCVT
ncbi:MULTISPECIES: hypothetical protein [Rhodopseudomonas]|uniref:Uncharacterized protein n=1 Tax=Rhodopseudomonas palustris TaxID=1076 RepID=A0A0D7EFK3_RHOPL|nr:MULTISPECIES: hypothetical protein [Rhodopseudomonas]KIZ39594.1 hypothetical protein OO17_19940 [Rhodopseudomonas palustris]MDF3812248.1 hypothetical protein [Rhodopseudomonas sp. BAL398]WOK15422.1 hypothetical protein RBJ75_14600 [Rhodopseudomonas sp. BAL398]